MRFAEEMMTIDEELEERRKKSMKGVGKKNESRE